MKYYVARDSDGHIWLYSSKPHKTMDVAWSIAPYKDCLLQLNSELLPEVKWSDEEPTEVELVIKKK